jgi:hypothetical protein
VSGEAARPARRGLRARHPRREDGRTGSDGPDRKPGGLPVEPGVIPAADLPETVDLEDCPIGGSVITDHGVGTILPAPGEGIHVEAMTTDGAQELQVTRYRDGTVELEDIGAESAEARDEAEIGVAGSSPDECSDRAYTKNGYRVQSDLEWFFSRNTTPDELSGKDAESAIRRGAANITDMQSNCRRGYRVPYSMNYQGPTNGRAQVDSRGHCTGFDDTTVVSFGKLPQGTLAVTCTRFPSGNVTESDIMINKARHSWTTNPGARSCRSQYDLESVMTHERGHTFGLGHVLESSHGKLTMSTAISACQNSERTFGLGAWLGLKDKY